MGHNNSNTNSNNNAPLKEDEIRSKKINTSKTTILSQKNLKINKRKSRSGAVSPANLPLSDLNKSSEIPNNARNAESVYENRSNTVITPHTTTINNNKTIINVQNNPVQYTNVGGSAAGPTIYNKIN